MTAKSIFYTWPLSLPIKPECVRNRFDILYHGGQQEMGVGGLAHFQGAIQFKTQKTWEEVHRLLPGVHVEGVKSWKKTLLYIFKDASSVAGTRYEEGVRPDPGRRTDWDDIKDLVTTNQMSSVPFEYLVRYPRGLEYARSLLHTPGRYREVKVTVIYGPTGCGKSRAAHEMIGDRTWWKQGVNRQWYDGYHGQQVAILDEFKSKEMELTCLLSLLDNYSLRVPYKGGYTEWLPEHIIITSNDDPRCWYPSDTDKVIRRLDECILMNVPIQNKCKTTVWK